MRHMRLSSGRGLRLAGGCRDRWLNLTGWWASPSSTGNPVSIGLRLALMKRADFGAAKFVRHAECAPESTLNVAVDCGILGGLGACSIPSALEPLVDLRQAFLEEFTLLRAELIQPCLLRRNFRKDGSFAKSLSRVHVGGNAFILVVQE